MQADGSRASSGQAVETSGDVGPGDMAPRPHRQEPSLLRIRCGDLGETWGRVHGDKNQVSSGAAAGGAGEEKARSAEEEFPEPGAEGVGSVFTALSDFMVTPGRARGCARGRWVFPLRAPGRQGRLRVPASLCFLTWFRVRE